jgi:hypothetical protein
MSGLRFLFPGPYKLWIIIVFFFFIAIGCQDGCRCLGCGGCNGCTTSVVIDQEAKKIKVDGIKMKLIANKNRVTNRKLKLDSILYVDKKMWFTVDYHLRVEDRPEIRNICDYEVPENQKLEESLNKFNIIFSPDKQHFAVGLDNHVFDFFHLLPDGVPFSSGCYYLNDSSTVFLNNAKLDFKDIKWNKFPNPDLLLDKIIVPNNFNPWALACNQGNVLDLLRGLPPGNGHDMVLIKNWFCEIAEIHFNQQRVEAIVKVSPEWKKEAEISLINCINKSISENDPELNSSLNMVLWISDPKLLKKSDSTAFNDYFAAGYVGDYFVKRFSDKRNPVNAKIYSSILSESKKIASNTFADPKSISLDNVIDILFIVKDFNVLKTFIDKNIREDVIVLYGPVILSATIGKYDKYPKEHQTVILENYKKIMQNKSSQISLFDMIQVMEFLKDKITCEELKKLVELHKEKLIGFSLPNGCQ